MHVWVAPISGGRFVIQLAAIKHLLEDHKGESFHKPDIALCTSGGNIATLVAMASGWDPRAIERICRRMKSTMLFEPHVRLGLLGLVIGFFKGSLYKTANGVGEFVKDYFTSKNIQDIEMWSGCYDMTEKKGTLFCNKSDSQCFLNLGECSRNKRCLTKCVYAGGDLELIGNYISASASVPVVVEGRCIKDGYYVDGGLMSASPLTHLKEDLCRQASEKDIPLHITYFSPVDMESEMDKEAMNVIGNWKTVTDCLTRQLLILDRVSAVDILSAGNEGGGNIRNRTWEYSPDILSKILEIREKLPRSVLEFFPKQDLNVDYRRFEGAAVISTMELNRGNFYLNFWWQSCELDSTIDMM